MILTCPSCSAQFNLDDDLLGETGRKVKCSSCEKIWFQEVQLENKKDEKPEDQTKKDNQENVIDEAEEEIPEEKISKEEIERPIVKENIEKPKLGNNHNKLRAKGNENQSRNKKLTSIAVAATLFFAIYIYLLVNNNAITQKYPSMYGFYKVLGIDVDIPGTGLIFDRVVAENNNKQIIISGNIVNLSAKEQSIPVIEASLLDNQGNNIDSWHIYPSKPTLNKEESLPFSFSHEIGKKAENQLSLRVRFIIVPKTDVASGENSQAHQQGESDHPSDHEVSSKSHQPASSAPHQEAEHH